MIAALGAVVVVLATGISVFVRGGDVNRRWSARLMNLRVATQFVVVLIVGALLLLRHLAAR